MQPGGWFASHHTSHAIWLIFLLEFVKRKAPFVAPVSRASQL